MIIFVYFYPLSALVSSDLETVINEWWNYVKVNSTVEFPKHQKFPKFKSSKQDLVWLQKIRTLLQPLIRTEIMVKKYYFSSEELLCFKYFFIEMLFPIIKCCVVVWHGLRTPREEIAFTAQPKIQSQSQIFRYGQSIFCLSHRPNFSDIFDLCLHWVSVVREWNPLISKM